MTESPYFTTVLSETDAGTMRKLYAKRVFSGKKHIT
jgi:hypothetical protein